MKLTKEQIGMEKISPSALMCYVDCPKLFYYKYWLGIQMEQHQRHLAFGNAYHYAIENIYAQYDDNFHSGWDAASLAVAHDAFKSKFHLCDIRDEEFQDVLKMKTNKYSTKEEMYKDMLRDGLSMIDYYWKNKEDLLVNHDIDITETEIPMKIEMRNPLNPEEKLPVLLSLRMDAMTRGRKRIIENKTSGSRYDEEETRQKLQGRSYAYAYLMTEGKMPESVDYVVSIKNKSEEKREIQIIRLQFDMADMVSYYNEVQTILQKIANREFDYGKVGGFSKMELDKIERALGLLK